MEASVEQLWGFVQLYGVEVALLAFVSIFLVGVIKLAFKRKFEGMNSNAKKAVYETISIAIAVVLTMLWMYVRTAWFNISTEPFEWAAALKATSATLVAVKVMYPVYENFGIRVVVRLAISFVASWFKKKGTNKKEVKEEDSTNKTINL